MNDLMKNLLLWTVIALVLLGVFRSFGPSPGISAGLSYSDFLAKVERERDRRHDSKHVALGRERLRRILPLELLFRGADLRQIQREHELPNILRMGRVCPGSDRNLS